jgi:2-polyprenyl-6-methoxyphenol hydroxylase-like FAD-dependent oxidoreductase
MLPSTGQGCCQGLEDVGALSVLLGNLSDKSEISRRFEIMTALRKDRETTIQYLSGIRMGQEEEFRKANPRHWIHKTPIKTGRDHIKFLYEYVFQL